jgi:putative redox protein
LDGKSRHFTENLNLFSNYFLLPTKILSMATHQINAKHHQSLAFQASIDEYTFQMDTTDAETIHAGPSPKKLMLASLAGCTGIDVVSILQKMQVPFKDFNIQIQADLTDEHPKIYREVRILYSISVDPTNQSKVERAVQLSKEKYCGVSAMFEKFAEIKWTIQFNPL